MRTSLRLVASSVIGMSLAACQNYTSAPLCTDANAISVPGTSGFYSASIQQADFSVKTVNYVITPGPEVSSLSFASEDGKKEVTKTCEVNGYYISEAYRPKLKAYSQMRLYVTGMGMTSLPLFYDRRALTDAGIATKVVKMPKHSASLLDAAPSDLVSAYVEKAAKLVDEDLGLIIDNSSVPARDLLPYSHALPVGLTLLRK